MGDSHCRSRRSRNRRARASLTSHCEKLAACGGGAVVERGQRKPMRNSISPSGSHTSDFYGLIPSSHAK